MKNTPKPIFELQAGKLPLRVYETRDAMGQAAGKDAARRINAVIARKGVCNVVFAAAPSQNETIAALVAQDVDWSRVVALHMDEYIGLPEDHPAGFGNFLRRAIFDRVSFKKIHFLGVPGLDGEATALRYEQILRENPPDVVLMGIGENGHLAFNDPHVADFKDPRQAKIVDLDQVCRQQQVNDGCFATIDDVPKQAVTLTMSLLLAIPEGICTVPGPTKAEAIYRTVHDPISEKCPSTALREISGCVLYTEKQGAAKLLEGKK